MLEGVVAAAAGGRIVIGTACGHIEVESARDVGSRASVALRPEAVRIGTSAEGDRSISCGPSYVQDPGAVLLANTETYKNASTNILVSIDGTPVSNPVSHWEVSSVFSGGIAQPGTALVGLYAGAGIDIVGQDISPSLVSGYLRDGYRTKCRCAHDYLWRRDKRIRSLRLPSHGDHQCAGGPRA